MPQHDATSDSSETAAATAVSGDALRDETLAMLRKIMDQKRNRMVLAFLLVVAALRSAAILMSPLGLGVDEAQYWLWSQEFDFGYYTKPPLTSWIIGLSHMIFGHAEWAVRLPAPWLHLATALVLWRATDWLYGPRAGRWAAILWTLLPLVSLGSFVISTDTPLLLAYSCGLLALAGTLTNRISASRGLFYAGLATGIAMLAKYAAIYFALSLLLFAAWDRIAPTNKVARDNLAGDDITNNRTLTLPAIGLFAVGLLLAVGPNLIWNLVNDFTTVRHLGDNANLAKQSYSPGNMLGFWGAQFGVAGPAAFALMLTLFIPPFSGRTRRLLICFATPPLLVISIQAFVSEANANWAAAALPALIIWLAHWISSPGGIRWGLLAASINGGIAAAFALAMFAGQFGPLTPDSDPLRRLRGWDQLAQDIAPALTGHNASMIVADRRATAALLSWHFHHGITDAAGQTIPVAIRVFDADGIPSNHFEQNLNWTPQPGRRLLAVNGATTPPTLPGVTWDARTSLSDHAISDNRRRSLYIYRGIEGPAVAD